MTLSYINIKPPLLLGLTLVIRVLHEAQRKKSFIKELDSFSSLKFKSVLQKNGYDILRVVSLNICGVSCDAVNKNG